MRNLLTEEERGRLDRLVAETEQRAGAQIVLSVVERSDVYAELPWKAFALGAGAGGLAVVLLYLLRGTWTSSADMLLAVGATLVPGAACALLCVIAPQFARFFLDAGRADVETRQYAESLFLARDLFATRGRTGVLLLISLFERKVIVLPDTGLARRLPQPGQQAIADAMTRALSPGTVAGALESGLGELERRLASGVPPAAGGNELPNTIIEEGRP